MFHGDLRQASDLEGLPDCDWVIDAAANPSVLAGTNGHGSSRQLLEHNLWGTIEIAEYCRRRRAGLILLSTSRVYSIPLLCRLPLKTDAKAFILDETHTLPAGISARGVNEDFSVAPPLSLYGSSKLASELLCLEYGQTFGFPVWANRCGLMAGAGQLGTAEQGLFSYWLHAHRARRRLRYIGFDGTGKQVRDALHPEDLADLIITEMRDPGRTSTRIWNIAGGISNAISLAELTGWCNERFGRHEPEADLTPRPFDIPWLVLDSDRACAALGWSPRRTLESILEEIACHAETNPNWLEVCEA
jgi:CDP-paratose 2-epimerase